MTVDEVIIGILYGIVLLVLVVARLIFETLCLVFCVYFFGMGAIFVLCLSYVEDISELFTPE
jgi:hypothetical protein